MISNFFIEQCLNCAKGSQKKSLSLFFSFITMVTEEQILLLFYISLGILPRDSSVIPFFRYSILPFTFWNIKLQKWIQNYPKTQTLSRFGMFPCMMEITRLSLNMEQQLADVSFALIMRYVFFELESSLEWLLFIFR